MQNISIVHWAKVKPSLPCWRFAQVAPRLIEELKYFERQSLVRQWELVAGILRKGQSGKDVYIAYGKPYNRGMEEREDGVRSDTQVFLDHGGEAYGLQITLINKLVAGWKIPAQRQMTPEAQKKRLELTEQRLMAKLRELDDNAERRHLETVGLLNDVLSNQDEMKDSLAGIGASVESTLAISAEGLSGIDGIPETGSGGGEGGNAFGRYPGTGKFRGTSKSSGSSCPDNLKSRIKLNNCVYNEIPGKCSMGKRCTLDHDNFCPKQYSCQLMTTSSGMCLPTDRRYSVDQLA